MNTPKPPDKGKHRNRGFSLIELLTTVGIIGVLASVAIPAYNGYRKSAAQGAVEAEIKNMQTTFDACMAAGNKLSACSTATIKNTLKREKDCAGTAPGASGKAQEADHNTCYYVTQTNNTETCWSVIKVSGSFVVSACASYDASDADWTFTKGTQEIGATYATGGTAPWDDKGICKSDSTCE